MILHDHPETASLYIESRDGGGAETREAADGVDIDRNGADKVVGRPCLDRVRSDNAGDDQLSLRDVKAA